jgi:hypothetical protein
MEFLHTLDVSEDVSWALHHLDLHFYSEMTSLCSPPANFSFFGPNFALTYLDGIPAQSFEFSYLNQFLLLQSCFLKQSERVCLLQLCTEENGD